MEEDRERVGRGVSMKESQVVVLTPDALSHRESFCPPRLFSALLLLMLLLVRRFGMLRRERQRDTEIQKEREREREVVEE